MTARSRQAATSSPPAARALFRFALAAVLAAASVTVTISGAPPASAHRDGCHRWHSCPSDSGSYVCGDTGHDTYCPGTEALPEAPAAVTPLYDTTPDSAPVTPDFELPDLPPYTPPDYEAPEIPTIASSAARAGGLIALTLTAEKGSTITVQEDGDTVATKKATGKSQTLTFTAADGEHSYLLTATDAAGNVSYETDAITLTADATKPPATLTPHTPTPLEGAARIDVNTEAGAKYALAVTGQKTITGTGSGTTDTHLLWLRNGTYHAVVTSTDAAGNVNRVQRDLRVANPSAVLTVTQTSAPFHTPIDYRLEGTPRSHGTLTLPGQDPQAFDLDDSGATTLSIRPPDGTYRNGTATLTDFGGRTATAALPPVTVDTTAPALTFTTDTARAHDGTLQLGVTAEKAAKVAIRAVRRGDTDVPTAPVTGTLVGNGASQPWSRTLEPGTYELTAVAVDTAGNQSTQTRIVTITKPATAGEIATALGLLIVLLGSLVGFLVLLWRKRHWIAATGERRRATAAARAHQAAVATAKTKYTAAQAAHDQAVGAFHKADRQWRSRDTELAQLITWAVAPLRSQGGDTYGLRLRPTERLLDVMPASLVEDRTKQGRPNRVTVAAGHAVVTTERVAFRGPKNRDWVYAQLEHLAVAAGSTILMTVSARKTRSGIRLTGPAAQVERGRLLLQRAIHASQGDATAVHRDLQDQRERHAASKPVPPRPPVLPDILQPPSDDARRAAYEPPAGAPQPAQPVGAERRSTQVVR